MQVVLGDGGVGKTALTIQVRFCLQGPVLSVRAPARWRGSQLARAVRGAGAHAQVSQSATRQLRALALRAMHVVRRRSALLHTLFVAAELRQAVTPIAFLPGLAVAAPDTPADDLSILVASLGIIRSSA